MVEWTERMSEVGWMSFLALTRSRGAVTATWHVSNVIDVVVVCLAPPKTSFKQLRRK